MQRSAQTKNELKPTIIKLSFLCYWQDNSPILLQFQQWDKWSIIDFKASVTQNRMKSGACWGHWCINPTIGTICFQADVIVNSTALQMSLKDGKVSTALSNKAGYALQAECTRKAPLNIGDVIDTDGYGLDCEKVLHVSCPLWSKGSSEKVLFFCMLGNLISNNNLVVFSLKYYWTFTTKTTISTTNPRKNL